MNLTKIFSNSPDSCIIIDDRIIKVPQAQSSLTAHMPFPTHLFKQSAKSPARDPNESAWTFPRRGGQRPERFRLSRASSRRQRPKGGRGRPLMNSRLFSSRRLISVSGSAGLGTPPKPAYRCRRGSFAFKTEQERAPIPGMFRISRPGALPRAGRRRRSRKSESRFSFRYQEDGVNAVINLATRGPFVRGRVSAG